MAGEPLKSQTTEGPVLTAADLPPLPEDIPASASAANQPLVIEQTGILPSAVTPPGMAANVSGSSKKLAEAVATEPEPTAPVPAVPRRQELPPLEEEEEPRRRRRGPLIPCSCRMITCTGCLLVLALLVFAGYVIIQKPPAIWDPLKVWLNDDLKAQTYNGTTMASVMSELETQADSFSVGRNELVITEEQFYTLVQDRLVQTSLSDLNVDLEHNLLRLYWNLDSGSDKPLWLLIEMGIDTEEQPYIISVGTPRVPMPAFLNNVLQQLLVSLIKIGSGTSETTLLNALLPGVNIEGARFEKDTLVLYVRVSSGLESIFD